MHALVMLLFFGVSFLHWSGIGFLSNRQLSLQHASSRRCGHWGLDTASRLQRIPPEPSRIAARSVPVQSLTTFLAGLAIGGLAASVRCAAKFARHSKEPRSAPPALAESESVGNALVQAAVRGPEGLDAQARVAFKLVSDAANAGMLEYATSGDFAAVGREAAETRQELVLRATEEIESGRADVPRVAEFLVDAALARAARCAQGGGDIYSELWSLDEGRASVATRRGEATTSGREGDVAQVLASKDILIDEQARGAHGAQFRPLFAHMQPHVLARPTALALLEVFEVFRRRGMSGTAYSHQDQQHIEHLLDEVDRTPVMRRTRAEAAKLRGVAWTDASWRQELRHIWFAQADGRCGFEHVFVGEASVDEKGRDIVGGLHNWFKFFLEEQRGAAQYLGRRYTGRTGDTEGVLNPEFVSGRFTWDFDGRHLVKDVGGFFVGVSPEWQLALATIAWFETETAERAAARHWSRDFTLRDVGFVRVARLGEHVYRLAVRRNAAGNLTTFFAAQLGPWDARARAELDEVLSTAEVEQKLPDMLVLHGFADEPRLLSCAARVGASGAFTLREALKYLRAQLNYDFDPEAYVANGDQAAIEVASTSEFATVSRELVDAHRAGLLCSSKWSMLLENLVQRTGLRGRSLYRPMRLALTGRLQGHDLQELMELLELLDHGAPWSETLVPLQRRIDTVGDWLGVAAAQPQCTSR